MGFRSLRVINEDVVAPGMGFGSHPHRDVEILTYVVAGALRHEDSMGNGEIIRAGDLQYMRAGKGVVHSEFNASAKEPVHFLQIWILPRARGGDPRYEQKSVAEHGFRLLASGEAGTEAIHLEQDAQISLGRLHAGEKVNAAVPADCGAWLQVIAGTLAVAGEQLEAGDAMAIDEAGEIVITANLQAEFLWFVLR